MNRFADELDYDAEILFTRVSDIGRGAFVKPELEVDVKVAFSRNGQ